MVEQDTEPASRLAQRLVEAGHSVHVCHDEGVCADSGVCVAVQGHPCPLTLAPMDLFLDVVSPVPGTPGVDRSGVEVLLKEEGILCAKRHMIPIVLVGATEAHPFGRFATTQRPDLPRVGDLEAVASSPLPDHSTVAIAALRSALRGRGIGAERAEAEVRRRNGGLVLHIDVGAPAAHDTAQAIAIRVGQAVRAMDPWASSLDIILAGSAS